MSMFTKDFNKWGKYFPHLFENYRKGEVYAYDSFGITHELSDYNKQVIERIEREGESYNLKVIAVINATYSLEGEPVKMSSYLSFDEEGTLEIIETKGIHAGTGAVLAYVDNTSWDIQEYGYVNIIEKAGLLFRIG